MSPRLAVNTKPEPAADTTTSFQQFRTERLHEYRARAEGMPSAAATSTRGLHPWWRHAVADELSDLEQRVLSKASGAAGSFLVPSDFYDQIVQVVRDRGSVAKVAKEIPTLEGRTLTVPITSAHGTGVWTSENASYTLSDDSFGLVALGAYKAETVSVVSEELLRDSGVNLDSYLADEFGGRLAVLEGAAYINGDGIGKPQGALANFPLVTAPTGSASSFTLTDLVEALHTVSPFYRQQGGAWIMSDGALKALRKVVTSTGDPILIDPDTDGGDTMLLGYPVLIDTNLPAPGANAKSVMFAGWGAAYVIRRVTGLSSIRQMYELYALNGQVGFFLKERVDGRVLLSAAGVTLQHSAT